MSKLYRARSLLYRRQILQVNIRWNSYLFEKKIEKRDMGSWKALDEIYKIYMLLHRSDLNVSEIFRQKFSHFWQNLQNFVIFEFVSLIFMKFARIFSDFLEKHCNYSKFLDFNLILA